jgi:hypothetical protein
MGVETTQGTEKYLSPQTELGTDGDYFAACFN